MTGFLLKSVLSMAALLIVYHLFLGKEKMHRFNRFYLLTALVFSLALPVVTIPVYVEADHLVQTGTAPTPLVTEQPLKVAFTSGNSLKTEHGANLGHERALAVSWLYIAGITYCIITVLLFVRFLINIGRFYRVAGRNKTVKLPGATIVLMNDCPLPYTFMHYIFLSEKDYLAKQVETELLTHELAHVRQHHTLDLLFVEFIRSILWFNPLLYLYKKAIQVNHEFLADEAVLSQYHNVSAYRRLLLDKALPVPTLTLASSINFSITKKRFTMMTKTTTKTKSILLRAAVIPVAASLVYCLSVKTIAYAKAPNGVEKEVTTTRPVAETLLPEILATDTDTAALETLFQATVSDTANNNARRDEYYKGVRVIISDNYRNVRVDKPYEKLTADEKDLYLGDVPEKKVAKGIDEEDYQFYLQQKYSEMYIDEKPVTRDEFLKLDRKSFASASYSYSFTTATDGKKNELFSANFYTLSYFNKNIKHLNDHYPEKVYKITVTDKPIIGKPVAQPAKKTDGVQLAAVNYESTVADPGNMSFKFPGGMDKFYEYFYANFKSPEGEHRKELFVIFDVNTDGSLSNIMTSEKNEAIRTELTRVITASPRWIPAQHDGKPTVVATTINVTF